MEMIGEITIHTMNTAALINRLLLIKRRHTILRRNSCVQDKTLGIKMKNVEHFRPVPTLHHLLYQIAVELVVTVPEDLQTDDDHPPQTYGVNFPNLHKFRHLFILEDQALQ